MIKDLLPIGSVVKLRDAKKPLMIYGIKQIDQGKSDKEYDYIGVLYPEGNIGKEFQYLFNHEDIVEICFRGYETEERTAFIKEIQKLYHEEV